MQNGGRGNPKKFEDRLGGNIMKMWGKFKKHLTRH